MIRRDAAQIRSATTADLREVVAIERLAFGDPWTRGMFAWHLDSGSADMFLIAFNDANAVAGYAIARVVGAESELFNIAVHPASRRMGTGAMLLDAVIQGCLSDGADQLWLEVRASNAAAIALYASRGFTAVARRKGYYNFPREDALVLRAELGPSLRQVLGCTSTIQRADAGLPSDVGAPILSSASQPPRQETI